MSRSSCACAALPGRRSPPFRPGEPSRIVRAPAGRGRIVAAKPILDVGKGATKCRPFLRVEKDDEAFAACNALADKLGPLNTPKKIFELIGEAIGSEVSEVFGVATLDIHLRLKGIAETGRGESSAVMAPVQSTLRAALASGGDYAIIFHVHPSGVEAEPSDADRETTEAFVEAFDIVGMPLADHIIVAGDTKRRSFYSFRQSGDLKAP